jgi:hypothetical protein
MLTNLILPYRKRFCMLVMQAPYSKLTFKIKKGSEGKNI